jgi:hypothetical protein
LSQLGRKLGCNSSISIDCFFVINNHDGNDGDHNHDDDNDDDDNEYDNDDDNEYDNDDDENDKNYKN